MFCSNCGKQVAPGTAFCDGCGAPMTQQPQMQQSQMQQPQMQQSSSRGLAILSYFGLLALIPYLANKDNDPFVAFHAKQGLNLAIIELIFTVISTVIGSFIGGIVSFVAGLVPTLFLVLQIVGFVYVLQGKMQELPIVSGIKIIK